MMRHWLSSFALVGALAAPFAFASGAQANPSLVFELRSGRIIEHKDAFQRWYPASLTKLMTAYVTFRAVQAGELQLDSPIRVSKHAAGEQPSKMGYAAGSVIRLDNALKMMLIKSANDIAMAIGENVGGSEKAFVTRMNAEAQRLGMTGTHFANPNGLHSLDQYTTARDLALLVMAIRNEFPQYEPYFAIEGLQAGKATIMNYNLLVGRLPGADGMKTGFVCASGFNMIGSATRDGRTLVAVVLGEQSAVERAETAGNLLNAGFANSNASSQTVSALPFYGQNAAVATDMRQEICEKKPAAELSEAGADSEKGPKSVYQETLTHVPTLVAVGPGNATGPTPKARLSLDGLEFADVPLPSWRPDLPPPAGAEPLAQGDRVLKSSL
ncbi:D-alanyl-D-alanine carboxypeptidase family protein [Corticibacterium sp. UT-5YL-CI-8]|nr:D-alanyl-D-alanine carboxypeptidase family protein [Tianweitania sp. UT-5YL-CI-8]